MRLLARFIYLPFLLAHTLAADITITSYTTITPTITHHTQACETPLPYCLDAEFLLGSRIFGSGFMFDGTMGAGKTGVAQTLTVEGETAVGTGVAKTVAGGGEVGEGGVVTMMEIRGMTIRF
ncbi:hypothetical protein TWF481_003142 [Arthrobotrys musiformis]|uniref:Dirigent protein n=1 Tax=Arthrobotrys musiformis TaxID=47236 RepID=A0AAV9VPI9_9PEZI